MELTDLYQGKSTKIRTKTYLSTKEYVEPFIEKISKYTDNYKILVKGPDQVSLTEDEEDVIFNRVLVIAYMPQQFDCKDHTMAICYSYALDAKKPIYKLFKVYVNKKNLNFAAFDQTWLIVGELKCDEAPSINIKDLIEKPGSFENEYNKLATTVVDRAKFRAAVGNHLTKVIECGYNNGFHLVKMSSSDVVNVFKNLVLDKTSELFIPVSKDIKAIDIYDAYSGSICNDPKDIFNRFEKLLILKTFIL